MTRKIDFRGKYEDAAKVIAEQRKEIEELRREVDPKLRTLVQCIRILIDGADIDE